MRLPGARSSACTRAGCLALAKSRLRHPELAEEITQSVFCTVASKLGRVKAEEGGYTEQGRFEAWLFRVAVNRIRDEIRRARRQAIPTEPDQMAGFAVETSRGEDSGAGGQDSGELSALRQAMAGLAPADREIVELRHHAGLSFNQIAEVLSEPLGTLLARHHRALRKLKDTMTRTTSAAEADV